MYLLDTDHLTFIQLAKPKVVERLNQVDVDEVATTVITKIEMLRGRYEAILKAANAEELLRAQQRLIRTEELFNELDIILLNAAAAAEFDKLRQSKKLKKIRRGDLLIASIALAQKATLVTRNLRDFQQISGLKIENWAD